MTRQFPQQQQQQQQHQQQQHQHDYHHLPDCPDCPPFADRTQVVVTTFNMLAPCYKRLHYADGRERPDRERDHREMWLARQDEALAILAGLCPRPDVLLLQEVWFDDEYVSRLRERLSSEYEMIFAQHPSPKCDGLATLVRKASGHIRLCRDILPYTIQTPDKPLRSALAVSLALSLSSSSSSSSSSSLLTGSSRACNQSQLLVINAHLTFPHSPEYEAIQRNEIEHIVQHATDTQAKQPLTSVMIAGDLNADTKSRIAKVFEDQAFRNCYSELNGPNAYPITHFNHRCQAEFVDHVYLKTPCRGAGLVGSSSSTSSPSLSLSAPSPSASNSNINNNNNNITTTTNTVSAVTNADNMASQPIPILSLPPPSSPPAPSPRGALPCSPTSNNSMPLCDPPLPPPHQEQGQGQGHGHDNIDNDNDNDMDVNSLEAINVEQMDKLRHSISVDDGLFESSDCSGSEPHTPRSLQRGACSSKQREQRPYDVVCLKPSGCSNYPYHLSSATWPKSFSTSDHRPVSIHFDIDPIP